MLDPIKRSAPTLLVDSHPAERKPELGMVVTTSLHKFEIFAACNESIGQRERRDQGTMARPFIVVGEAVAIMTYVDFGFLKLDEIQRDNVDFVAALTSSQCLIATMRMP